MTISVRWERQIHPVKHVAKQEQSLAHSSPLYPDQEIVEEKTLPSYTPSSRPVCAGSGIELKPGDKTSRVWWQVLFIGSILLLQL